jgi:hypothetical protein
VASPKFHKKVAALPEPIVDVLVKETPLVQLFDVDDKVKEAVGWSAIVDSSCSLSCTS